MGEENNSGGTSEFISLLESFFPPASISPASNSFLGSEET